MRHVREWIRERVPQRVNSGFYYLGEPFPHERMEDMLARNLFDPTRPYNTDQEIMAYLFRNMELYHPEDLKRSRRGMIYDLANDPSAVLHFPSGMWQSHINQIESLYRQPARPAIKIRHQQPAPLTRTELLRMRFYLKLAESNTANIPIRFCRYLRNRMNRLTTSFP